MSLTNEGALYYEEVRKILRELAGESFRCL
jgi:hypothetical protein